MLSDDKPKSEVKSRAKQRMEDSKNAAEKIKGKRGSHALNTSDKINIMTLSVQRISMDVEVKQIIVLSHASQDSSLKSQIDSTHKLAVIVCPTYDEIHIAWQRAHTLMAQHEQLGKNEQAIR